MSVIKILLALLLFSVAFAICFYIYRGNFGEVRYSAQEPQNAETIFFHKTPNLATSSIFFTGDVMLARHVETLLRSNLIKPTDFVNLFSDAKAVVINFESSMAPVHKQAVSGEMRFSTHVNSLALLNKLEVSHASLANNHTSDYGKEGYTHAIKVLAENHITAFGHSSELGTSSITVIEVEGKKLAVIGIHTLFKSPTDEAIKNSLSLASDLSDMQIAYVHWGDEYELKHNRAQEELATKLIENGADLIIGHHPHVTQDIQMIKGVPVLYSLGNFIFDQYFSEEVKRGYIVELVIGEFGQQILLHPHSQCVKSTPCYMNSQEKEAYLQGLADRSDSALKQNILEQKLPF